LLSAPYFRSHPTPRCGPFERHALTTSQATDKLRKQNLIAERILLLLPPTMTRQPQIRTLNTRIPRRLRPPIKPARLGLAQVRTDLVRRHELLVLVDDGAAETRLLDHNGREYESRPDFYEADVELGGMLALLLGRSVDVHFVAVDGLLLAWLGLVDLVDADPDFAVCDCEAHDVVDEGLDFAACFGHAEDLREELFDDAQMGLLVECSVEGEDGARAFEAVADEV